MISKVMLVSLVALAIVLSVSILPVSANKGWGDNIVLHSPGSKLVMGHGGKKGGHNIILTEGCDKCKCNHCGGWDHGWGHEIGYLPMLGYGMGGYRR